MADRNGNYRYPSLTCLLSLSSHETPRSPAARAGSSGGRVVVPPRADRPRVVHVAALPGWITRVGSATIMHSHPVPCPGMTHALMLPLRQAPWTWTHTSG